MSPYRTIERCLLPLAGIGKTILARENFDGPHVWDKRRILLQDSRARRAGRARRTKRGGNQICPRRAFFTCLAFHALRSMNAGGLFSILLIPLDQVLHGV